MSRCGTWLVDIIVLTHVQFNCQGGYFISGDPAAFDAPFFSISTKEAAGRFL